MFTSVAVKLPLLSRLGLPLQQHRNLAFVKAFTVVILLTSSSTLGGVSANDNSVHSDNMIKDIDGKDVGPNIFLSNTVLETNQVLSYKCIKNSDIAVNELTRRNLDGTEVGFTNPKPSTCSLSDLFFMCTILTGTVEWSRDKGGKYYCSANPENWYYIHWINPDSVTSSGDKDLSSQSYGGSVVAKCGMDITPTTISYEGILEVTWRFVGSASGSSVTNLKKSNTVSWGLEPRGPNSSLTITDFNPIQHGGEYQCIGRMPRYSKTLTGPRFKIWGKPSAKLRNNKRRDFTFGKYESNVKFTCEGLSYPFPEKIEFRLQANVVNEHTKGVTHYEVDRVKVDVDKHTATFTVANMSEVFTNGSLLDCTVWRREGDLEVTSQRRVILVEEDPPIDLTTPEGEVTLPPHVSTRKAPTEPWKIAIGIIIPIVIILIIIILLVWKRKICKMDESGGNSLSYYPSNDLSMGAYSASRTSLARRRDPTYGRHSYSSEYAQSKVHQNPIYGSGYAQSKVHQNPIYGSGHYGDKSIYQTPVSRPGTMSRQQPRDTLPRRPLLNNGLSRQNSQNDLSPAEDPYAPMYSTPSLHSGKY